MNFRILKSIIYTLIFVQSFLIAQTDSSLGLNQYALADTVKGLEYFSIGKAYLDKAKYDSSVIAYKKVESIYSNLLQKNDDRSLWIKFIQAKTYIGFNLCYLSRYDEAKNYLSEANKLCKEKLGDDNKTAAQIYQALGIYYDYNDDMNNALDSFFKALEIRLKIFGDEHSDVADTYNSIGIIYSKRSNLDKALEYFTKSLQIKKKLFGEEHSNTASAYNNIGINCYDRGDYGKALEYYRKSLSIRLKVLGEQHHLTASSYNNIGNAYYTTGDLNEAYENHLKSLTIRKNLYGEKHDLVATSYNNLGLVELEKKEYDSALVFFNKSLDIRIEKFKVNNPSVAQAYMNIGLVYYAMKNFSESLNYYEKALNIWKNLGETELIEISKIYQNIAELYYSESKYDSSLAAIQKSLITTVFDFNDSDIESNPDLNFIASEVQLLNSLKIKSKNYLAISSLPGIEKQDQIKELNNSLRAIELADKLVDKMVNGFRSDASKYFLGEKTVSMYELAVETSVRLFELTGDIKFKEKAFYFIEKNKAGVLRQGMLESRAKHFANISTEVLEKEKALKDDLLYYNTQLQSEQQKVDKDSLKLYNLQNKVFDLKNDYEKLISSIEVNYPAYFNLKYKSELKNVTEIQKNIPSKTALIDYFVGEKAIYIAVITRDDYNVIKINKTEKFNEVVKDFYTSIIKSETTVYIESANTISETILLPALNKLSDIKNLTIIPHDFLFKVPFEALFVKKQSIAGNNYRALDYLIKHFNISYHYSANLWIDEIEKNNNASSKKHYDKNFVGFAPVFSKNKSNGYTVSSDKKQELFAQANDIFRPLSADGNAFDELKYSEWEVNSILDLYKKSRSNLKSTAYFFDDATEDTFKVNAGDSKIIHIASHSFMNELNPDISGVIFSQPNDTVVINDGVLFAGETYNLKLNADLVVLSSCESGLGKLFKGEGMIALNRGFLYSGADNILFSLWKISDKHTSELMVEFYRQMISGKTYSESIRDAKLKLIKKEITARPRSWAAFLLIGID